MESEVVNPPEGLPKQASPVKDAVRTLEAQLASQVTSVEGEQLSEEQATIAIPLEEVVINTQVIPESGDTTMEQQASGSGTVSAISQEQLVEEHAVPIEMQITQEQQQQIQQLNEQHQEIQQRIPEQNQPQQQLEDQQQQLQQQQQIILVQEQPLMGHTHQQQLSEQLHVQLVEEQPMETGQEQSVMQIEANIDSSQSEATNTANPEPKPFFKCVAVTPDGSPDWSKVMNLNKDILKEVLEKHGISMDTSAWLSQTEGDEAARKKKKKAKKAKKKKMKDKSKKYKGKFLV